MLEDRIREIAREEIAAEFARRQSDRPDDPVTGAQVRLVHARRSAAGVTQDELKALLGERFGVDSLTELSQVRLDELLEWLAARGAARSSAAVDL
jgi:hypothetical protein